MARYPILFDRTELIEGNGFVARVIVAGRALLTEEDGGFWAEGVNPGGFAATGASTGEALNAFCREYRSILFDIAVGAATFQAFKGEVEKFFQETSEVARGDWEQAVIEVRTGRTTADWLAKRPADSPLRVEVVEVRQPKAENNEEGETAIAA